MAKKKKTEDDFLSEIKRDTGGESLTEGGKVPYWIDTGNFALNYQISGNFLRGWPCGRIIEAMGPEASGKSLLGYCFLGNVQKMGGIAVLFDCERSSSDEFARRCGHVDPDRLLTYYPVTLEQVEKKAIAVVNKIREVYPDRPIGIMWDSIGVNPCEREWAAIELPEDATAQQIKDAGGRERPGERAKAANKILRSLNPFLNENNATIYVINQIRQKIGVMFGNPETGSGGAEALKFYASVRFRTNAPKAFVDKKKFPLGVNMSVTNKKNRHNTPGLRVENVPLFFASGINPLGGLLGMLNLCGRIETAGKKGTYKVCEPWSGGEEIKFTLEKTKPFDPEVLYRCPALIDADNAEQIKEYLSEWETAIQTSGVADEVDNKDDIDHLVGE